ncbi:hypothetical protein BC567DRAFT_227464 [Phyllosticta citribraziliensis]
MRLGLRLLLVLLIARREGSGSWRLVRVVVLLWRVTGVLVVVGVRVVLLGRDVSGQRGRRCGGEAGDCDARRRKRKQQRVRKTHNGECCFVS